MKIRGRHLLLLLCPMILMGVDDCHNESTRQVNRRNNNNERLLANQPGPQISFSMDRWLLAERLTRFNDPNKMSYLYACFPDGTWLKVTIVGKLASTSKRLSNPDYTGTSSGANAYSYAGADEMGTWGSSQPDKVGMTTLGSLLELGGFMGFVYSEVPLSFGGMDKQIVEVNVEATADERAAFLLKLEGVREEMRRSVAVPNPVEEVSR